MPLYEYRLKSGSCDVCSGCFVDLQKMSDPAHEACPDCGRACERVLSAPIVSVRGEAYKKAAQAETRKANWAKANLENAKMRAETQKKYAPLEGHTHDCAAAGCYGETVRLQALGEGGSEKAVRFGNLPHLVGSKK